MRAGDDFLNQKENVGLSMVRVNKENPAMDVAFFAGYKSIASLDQHIFWTTDTYGAVLEKGAKFPNDNVVSFECFKSVTGDTSAFCPGCMVEKHSGTKPNRTYYAPVIDNKVEGVQVIEMKPTIGNKLRKMIISDFIGAGVETKFADFWFKISYTGIKGSFYEIDRSLQELDPEYDRPEWDISGETDPMGDFLQTIQIIRDMENVVLDMQLNSLWSDDMTNAYDDYLAAEAAK